MTQMNLVFLVMELMMLLSMVTSSHLVDSTLYTIGAGILLSAVIARLELALYVVRQMEASMLLLDIGELSEIDLDKPDVITVPAGYTFDGKVF